jgi:hypothetical protein
LMSQMTEGFVADIDHFVAARPPAPHPPRSASAARKRPNRPHPTTPREPPYHATSTALEVIMLNYMAFVSTLTRLLSCTSITPARRPATA